LERFITAVLEDEVIEKETRENDGRSRLFPGAKLYKLEKEHQLDGEICKMEHVHRVHQVCVRRLDVKKRKEQVYQKERENTENAETVVPRSPEIRGKILRDAVVECAVVTSAIVQRSSFNDTRQRKKKKKCQREEYENSVSLEKLLVF
jgi:hypothetical protein